MILLIIIIIFVSAFITFISLIKVPTIPDRIVVANAIGIMFFSIILLLSYYFNAKIFLDIAVVYAILQFVDVLIMAKYLGGKESGDIC